MQDLVLGSCCSSTEKNNHSAGLERLVTTNPVNLPLLLVEIGTGGIAGSSPGMTGSPGTATLLRFVPTNEIIYTVGGGQGGEGGNNRNGGNGGNGGSGGGGGGPGGAGSGTPPGTAGSGGIVILEVGSVPGIKVKANTHSIPTLSSKLPRPPTEAPTPPRIPPPPPPAPFGDELKVPPFPFP